MKAKFWLSDDERIHYKKISNRDDGCDSMDGKACDVCSIDDISGCTNEVVVAEFILENEVESDA